MLLSKTAVDTAIHILSASDFYAEAHAIIFETMGAIAHRSQPIDQITLRAELVSKGKLSAVGGDEYLLALTDVIPSIEHTEAHAAIVREKATVRRLIAACQEIAAKGYSDYGEFRDFLDHAESTVFGVAKERESNPYEMLKTVVSRTFS